MPLCMNENIKHCDVKNNPRSNKEESCLNSINDKEANIRNLWIENMICILNFLSSTTNDL